MNMATALLSVILDSVPAHLMGESLLRISIGFFEFLENCKNLSLGTALVQRYNLSCRIPQDKWTLPDVIWQAICYDQPAAAIYPWGDIAERAFKKTVYLLSERFPVTGATPASRETPQSKDCLQSFLESIDYGQFMRSFLTHYLFELCIAHLRRPSKDPDRDFGFLYHFLRNGDFAPLSIERDLRVSLSSQCEEIANRLCPFFLGIIGEGKYAQSSWGATDNLYGVLRLPKPEANIIVVGKEARVRFNDFYVHEPARTRYLQLHTADANVAFALHNIEHYLGHSIHPLVKDLFDIGVCIYISDLYSKREHHLGRCIELFMPVRYPSVWNNAQREIERAISFLGRDEFSIRFLQSDEKGEQAIDFSTEVNEEQCVSLFSGGLDSLAGVVWTLEQGIKPILVSHYANNRLAGLQASLIAHLEQIYGQRLQHIGIYVGKAKGRKVQHPLSTPYKFVMAQHLRSFMFLALATGIALEQRVNTIYIFENGPVALNPVFSEARINTRTAHPCFLGCFQALIRAVFGVELTIRNPFLYFTKGEVGGVLGKSEQTKNLIARTSSCAHWFRVPLMAKQRGANSFKGIHDGMCLPCIVRRVAVHSAGLWDYDTLYLTDIFNDYPNIDRSDLTAVADYLRFCWNVREASEEIFSFAPEFSICAEDVDNRKLAEMYKRHSEEVIECFRERSNSELRKCFEPVLEK